MSNSDFDKEYLLKQYEARCKCFCDSNQSMVDVGRSALRGALFLNGMGAVAVLYSPQIQIKALHPTLLYFAIGALLATMACGATYVTQAFVAASWKPYLYSNPNPSQQERDFHKKKQDSANKWGNIFRGATIALIIFSYICFGFGAGKGYCNLEKRSTTQSTPQQLDKPL